MEQLQVAGCDCGKSSLHVCVIDQASRPKDLKRFARSYTPLVFQADREGVEALLSLPVDVYAIEPTGHYSLIWVNAIRQAGKQVVFVSPRRVRHFCEYQGLTNKADRPDAAAISIYTLDNYGNEQAFIKGNLPQLRSLYLQYTSTSRSKNPIQNRLGQRLAFEFPEIVPTYENQVRRWLSPNPPAPIRFLAGEPPTPGDRLVKKRQETLEKTIGCGLSDHSKRLASQLCEFDRIEYELEVQITEELALPEFSIYNQIFDQYLVPPVIRAAILGRVYPFTDFLRDGKPLKEYVRGTHSQRKSGMTKRDRSEGEFKLSLGMGKELAQSGSSEKWKAGGARYARTALWMYVKSVIVVGRVRDTPVKNAKELAQLMADLLKQHHQPKLSPWLNQNLINALATETGTTFEVAALRLHYEYQSNKKGDQRVSSTAGRFCRMLYKSFLEEFC